MSRAWSILVVDDDHDISEALAFVLESSGFVVTCARDADQAWTMLQSGTRPGLILLDLMMPGMPPTELKRRLDRAPTLAHIPVVVLSGDPGARSQAAALHAAGCLMKPPRLQELLAMIRRLLPGRPPAT
jgi:CheY-like chemotaxis protein